MVRLSVISSINTTREKCFTACYGNFCTCCVFIIVYCTDFVCITASLTAIFDFQGFCINLTDINILRFQSIAADCNSVESGNFVVSCGIVHTEIADIKSTAVNVNITFARFACSHIFNFEYGVVISL